MNKFCYVFLIVFVIIVSLAVNHKFYGTSNSTLSNYEAVKYYLEIQERKKESKILADYIYKRTQYYQKFDDKSYIKMLLLWDNYNYGTDEQIKGVTND